jgi:hypothetical protein
MWSHGYNYAERDRDRNAIIERALSESDRETYDKLRRWGVRYVVAEYAPRHERPSERAFQAAQEARSRGEDVQVPQFDPHVYLNGAITRVFNAGRFEVFRVN